MSAAPGQGGSTRGRHAAGGTGKTRRRSPRARSPGAARACGPYPYSAAPGTAPASAQQRRQPERRGRRGPPPSPLRPRPAASRQPRVPTPLGGTDRPRLGPGPPHRVHVLVGADARRQAEEQQRGGRAEQQLPGRRHLGPPRPRARSRPRRGAGPRPATNADLRRHFRSARPRHPAARRKRAAYGGRQGPWSSARGSPQRFLPAGRGAGSGRGALTQAQPRSETRGGVMRSSVEESRILTDRTML